MLNCLIGLINCQLTAASLKRSLTGLRNRTVNTDWICQYDTILSLAHPCSPAATLFSINQLLHMLSSTVLPIIRTKGE